jgi:serine/threonine-protein kinase HipA
MEDEKQYALNLGKTKEWYEVTYAHFEMLAKRADVPWRAIKPHLDDTMEKARSLWPEKIKDLPMNEEHKDGLITHWANLQTDFQI